MVGAALLLLDMILHILHRWTNLGYRYCFPGAVMEAATEGPSWHRMAEMLTPLGSFACCSAMEMLSRDDKFFCDTCGCLQEAQKRLLLQQLPQCLIFHLKRFKYMEQLNRWGRGGERDGGRGEKEGQKGRKQWETRYIGYKRGKNFGCVGPRCGGGGRKGSSEEEGEGAKGGGVGGGTGKGVGCRAKREQEGECKGSGRGQRAGDWDWEVGTRGVVWVGEEGCKYGTWKGTNWWGQLHLRML